MGRGGGTHTNSVADGHERRMSIASAIYGLGKPSKSIDEKMDAVSDVFQEAKATAEANGKMFDPEKDMDLDAFHSISGDSGAKGLVEMVVVPLKTFKAERQIPRRSFRNKTQHHIPASSLGPDDKVLFFSQRWLTPSPRSAASPDDAPGGTKYKQLMAACEAFMKAMKPGGLALCSLRASAAACCSFSSSVGGAGLKENIPGAISCAVAALPPSSPSSSSSMAKPWLDDKQPAVVCMRQPAARF